MRFWNQHFSFIYIKFWKLVSISIIKAVSIHLSFTHKSLGEQTDRQTDKLKWEAANSTNRLSNTKQ